MNRFADSCRPTIAISAAALLAVSFSAAAPVANASEISMMKGPDRQAKLEAGAKKEGEVVHYTTLIVNQAVRPIKKAFEKKYPYVKFSYIRANSAKTAQRVMSEARAGKTKSDVVIGSTVAALAHAKLLEPFYSPESEAYTKEYHGKDNLWMTYRDTYYGIGYNSKLIKPGELETWEDLLKPKFKGKMIWSTSLATGGTFAIAHLQNIWGKKKAGAFFDKLAKQDIATSSASIRAILDLVVAEEHWILISSALHHVMISKGKGAPAWFAAPDPVMNRPDDIQLVKDAPHPHAAMLFIDFILSEEGQKTLAKAKYIPSRPGIDPPESLNPIIPRLNGKKQRNYSSIEMLEQQKELKAIFKRISRH